MLLPRPPMNNEQALPHEPDTRENVTRSLAGTVRRRATELLLGVGSQNAGGMAPRYDARLRSTRARPRAADVSVRSETMKKFLAIYIGTAAALEKSRWNELDEESRKALRASGVNAWEEWAMANSAAIVDQGSPLGKTKRASSQGITDIRNDMTGYVIIQAESHEAAARMFENHPHFAIFPGDSVEIMECLPLPGQ